MIRGWLKMWRDYFRSIPVLLVVGCAEDPVSTSRTNNPGVPVSLLFKHDGCSVYRFDDGGRYHYYAVCPGAVTAIGTRTENCGKNCWRERDEAIPTSAVEGDGGLR